MKKLKEILIRFLPLIVSVAENGGFIAYLATIPNIQPKHLIMAHIIVLLSKSYLLRNHMTTLPVNNNNSFSDRPVGSVSQTTPITKVDEIKSDIVKRIEMATDDLVAKFGSASIASSKEQIKGLFIWWLAQSDEQLKNSILKKLSNSERKFLGY
jgi:hypothetical protein